VGYESPSCRHFGASLAFGIGAEGRALWGIKARRKAGAGLADRTIAPTGGPHTKTNKPHQEIPYSKIISPRPPARRVLERREGEQFPQTKEVWFVPLSGKVYPLITDSTATTGGGAFLAGQMGGVAHEQVIAGQWDSDSANRRQEEKDDDPECRAGPESLMQESPNLRLAVCRGAHFTCV